jgi:2-amino-4-hydroxy-6-hydroxymethyldihydropteridine diphosphokinase
MATQIFVTLGSNIEPEKNLPEAVRLLAARVRLTRASRVYRSAPVGSTGQPDFLNAALLVETDLPPYNLKFNALRDVETQLGRVRSDDKFAARTIDLDLALYGDLVLDDPQGGLSLPDPDILMRAHIALPLADLAPGFVHPVSGETLGGIAARLKDTPGIQVITLKLIVDFG